VYLIVFIFEYFEVNQQICLIQYISSSALTWSSISSLFHSSTESLPKIERRMDESVAPLLIPYFTRIEEHLSIEFLLIKPTKVFWMLSFGKWIISFLAISTNTLFWYPLMRSLFHPLSLRRTGCCPPLKKFFKTRVGRSFKGTLEGHFLLPLLFKNSEIDPLKLLYGTVPYGLTQTFGESLSKIPQ